MAHDIDQRLKALNSRRRGTDRIAVLSADAAVDVLIKRLVEEAYSKRAPGLRHTEYVLGAMQAVDPDYTRISIEEAERVGKQILGGLRSKGLSAEFRLQGSVPCDIHIRGVSDVDLLVIEDRYFRYATEGIRAQRGDYSNPVSYDTLIALGDLRTYCEEILSDAYPATNVDKTGAKAIKISGGSLRRPVDVVPSNWFDTPAFQLSARETDRGIEILDKTTPERVLNTPFLHIERIGAHDLRSGGGLKKAIRLCKNVKADAEDEGTKIKLSSFDIASAMWHADLNALNVSVAHELAILEETQRHLDFLARRRDYAATLQVPDGTRCVFDTDEKFEALIQLSLEIDDLAEKVAREQARFASFVTATPDSVKDILRRSYIPG
ncbi:hypothetical protein [Crenobacter cavernae]|uniref:Nucleotidyltransferase n=1 Tax=Crenobacter cavernae TaxID=2290923 RepID=A0A345Y8D9_9NEIS|nr:hypothetical protein [Crenobacter cavernae]AXK40191.1 hypothetical protein DWG20_12475 [Crenobacter cavernae]